MDRFTEQQGEIRKIEISQLKDSQLKSFAEWHKEHQGYPFGEISEEELYALIPPRVYESAGIWENISVAKSNAGKENEIRLFVLEKNSNQEPTTQENRERYTNALPKNVDGVLPEDYGVEPLHAEFAKDIFFDKKVTFEDKILMFASIERQADDILLISYYAGQKHQGIASSFYKESLPGFARELGVRFIVGHNNLRNLSFYVDSDKGLGRSHLGDIKPEFRKKFFPRFNPDENPEALETFTIQFLYEEDKEKYCLAHKE